MLMTPIQSNLDIENVSPHLRDGYFGLQMGLATLTQNQGTDAT